MGRKKIRMEGLRDRIGETVDLMKCPTCAEHQDCFACMEGRCTALKESGGQDCVFYKPATVELARCKESYRRLKDSDKNDLILKYIKPLTALGVLDDEIGEAEAVSCTMEEFETADYQKQLMASGILVEVSSQMAEMVT